MDTDLEFFLVRCGGLSLCVYPLLQVVESDRQYGNHTETLSREKVKG